MSIAPARAPAPVNSADAKPAAGTGSSPTHESVGASANTPVRQGWLPHHLKSQVHAAHWVAAMHRAMPQASMGVRAGALVPPRGSVLSHSPSRAPSSSASKSNNAKSAKSSTRGDTDTDGPGGADGDVARGLQIGTAHAAVGGAGDFGGGMGSGADGGTSAQLLAQQALSDRGDHDTPGIDLGLTAADGAAVIESPAQIAARLRNGEMCWVQSFRQAMECAQHHPGTDMFVQAFNMVDSDGCVISSFQRRARLRATAEGQVEVFGPTQANAEGSDSALMDELASSPLLALSLRPVLDEAGNPATALHNVAPAELSQLRRLFERMPPAGLRDALCAAATQQLQRWQTMREREDFDQRVANHGDALERELNDQRARLSSTINAGDLNAHRANANWLRAQAQVAQWAERGERPTFKALCCINELLGEGLKPWNRAEQAERVGARFGELRRVDVVAGTPPQYFLRADQLHQAIDELFAWYEEQQRFDSPWFLVAAQMHQRLLTLHPFADANGRSARLVLDWLLMLGGLPPPLLQLQNLALFANESDSRQAAAGLAERTLLGGVIGSLDLHLQWLGLDGEQGG
jgi:Fic/DOC family